MHRFCQLLRGSIAVVAALGSQAFCDHRLYAQAGLRESLERLDRDQDGRIEPEEITPLARPFLERIAKSRRLSLDKTNNIDTWQEAARIYFALQNGVAEKNIVPEDERSLKPFEPDGETWLIPEFGLSEVQYRYTQADLDEAEQTIRRYDRNRDGYIDRAEAARSKWTHRDPFEMDLDRDQRLSRMELTQRYARRRLLSDDAEELLRKAQRTGGDIRRSTLTEQERREQAEWWRKDGGRYYLTASVLGRFDANRNGRLEGKEAQSLGVPIGRIDMDHDGELSREELHAFLAEKQDEAGDFLGELPEWFDERDLDGDGQVAMAEFADDWTDSTVREFTALDANQDGLLTAIEVIQSTAAVGGGYTTQIAEVLPPQRSIISEIEIDDDYLIGDLNVQLSITHTSVSMLDAYLTGPDGQRVELFTAVGGSGDHFEQTVFDDQSQYSITKARAPFKGTFAPEALAKRQPSLSHFNGKSVRGVWQLVIRGTRSDRFGMLHGWGVLVKPQEELPPEALSGSSRDGPQVAADSAERRLDRAALDWEGLGGKELSSLGITRLMSTPERSYWESAKQKIEEKLDSNPQWSEDQKQLARKELTEKYKQKLQQAMERKQKTKNSEGDEFRKLPEKR